MTSSEKIPLLEGFSSNFWLRNIRNVEYKKYDNTTQITNLPGGIKRKDIEITDDKQKLLKKKDLSLKSFGYKMDKDYKSNISCLPGTMVNSILW